MAAARLRSGKLAVLDRRVDVDDRGAFGGGDRRLVDVDLISCMVLVRTQPRGIPPWGYLGE